MSEPNDDIVSKEILRGRIKVLYRSLEEEVKLTKEARDEAKKWRDKYECEVDRPFTRLPWEAPESKIKLPRRFVEFNLNNKVQVKLTPSGREIMRKNHDRLWKGGPPMEYNPPHEDAEGWSEWQLHSLISEFGPFIYLGCEVPFETDMRFMKEADQ